MVDLRSPVVVREKFHQQAHVVVVLCQVDDGAADSGQLQNTSGDKEAANKEEWVPAAPTAHCHHISASFSFNMTEPAPSTRKPTSFNKCVADAHVL